MPAGLLPVVLAFAALTTAVVAPSEVVLAAVMPASGGCNAPATDVAPHRRAPSSKVPPREGGQE